MRTKTPSASERLDVASLTPALWRPAQLGKTCPDPTASRARPLSPHLQVYRFIPTIGDVDHPPGPPASRSTSGTLIIMWWLVAASTSPDYFETVNWMLGSLLGRLVLFGYTWVLIHHMVGGIQAPRLGYGPCDGKRTTSTKIAIAMPFISIGVTVADSGFLGYMARGA